MGLMKRKMVFIGMGYACGLFFASFFNIFISLLIAVVFAVSAIFCLKSGRVRQLGVFAASFFIAAGVMKGYTHFVYDKTAAYDGKTLVFTGKILSANSYANDKALYVADGKTADNVKMKLVFYADDCGGGWGDVISVTGTASLTANTYTFAEADYYRAQGVFLRLENAAVTGIMRHRSPVKLLLGWRGGVMERFRTVLPGDEGDALCAMLFGEKTGMDSKAKTLMFRSGIGHVMSASGLHLVICASAVLWILRFFTKNRRIQAAVIIAVSALFVICAGMSVAVIRSFVMLFLLYSARFFSREADSLNSLSAAVFVLLLPCPYAVTGSSLLLSAAGTFGIGVAAPYLSSVIRPRLLKPVFTMLCVSLCVFPISLLFFDEVSLISPLANLILIPICTLALIFVFIAALLPFEAATLIRSAGALCRIVLLACDKLGRLSFAFLPSGSEILIYAAFFLAAALFAVWLFSRKPLRIIQGGLAAICAFTLISSLRAYACRDAVRVQWFGYSGGYAAVISKGRAAVVIDMGASGTVDERVAKYLSRAGITAVPVILVTKNSASRTAAYLDELALFSPGRVYSTSALNSLPAEYLSADSAVVFGGYRISFGDKLEISGGKGAVCVLDQDFVLVSGAGIFSAEDTFEIIFD